MSKSFTAFSTLPTSTVSSWTISKRSFIEIGNKSTVEETKEDEGVTLAGCESHCGDGIEMVIASQNSARSVGNVKPGLIKKVDGKANAMMEMLDKVEREKEQLSPVMLYKP